MPESRQNPLLPSLVFNEQSLIGLWEPTQGMLHAAAQKSGVKRQGCGVMKDSRVSGNELSAAAEGRLEKA